MPLESKRFFGWWIFSSLVAWPMSILVAIPLGFIGSLVLQIFLVAPLFTLDTYDYTTTTASSAGSELFFTVLALAYLGGVIGLVVGKLQKRLVGRYLFYDVRFWSRASLIGGVVGALVLAVAHEGFLSIAPGASGYRFDDAFVLEDLIYNLIPMTVYVLVLSGFQWLALRRYVNNAWLWVLANGVGGVLFSMYVVNRYDMELTDWLFGTVLQAIVTGGTILWLFLTSVRTDVTFQMDEPPAS